MLPPRLLVLALSLPEVAYAVGLGAIRVESSLNEPLSAQIEVIGATPDELQAIRAQVASPEYFQRFSAERPAFLSSATIAVGADATGKPVLNIHSTAPFTEPLVEFLIDLRFGGQQLVRDYTVLLDPAHAAPAASTILATNEPVSDETSSVLVPWPQIEIPDDALTPIPVDAQAPSNLVIAPASAASNANRVRSHKVAWRGRPASPRAVVAKTSLARSAPDADRAAVLSALNKLNGQVQFLQQTLGETSRQLASANARIGDMERGDAQQPVVASRPEAERGKSISNGVILGSVLGALAVMAGAMAYAWRRLKPIQGSTDSGITVELTQVTDIDVDTVEQPTPVEDDEPDTVVLEELAPANDATGTVLDYNLADLDSRAQHVEMPDTLRDRPVLVERRKNIVDTLLAAVKRDPTRGDLRIKLLETLYTTAATNLRVFKEVVREVTRHPERLSSEQWEQVMAMGRQIAPDDALFTDTAADSKVADCA